MISSLPACTAGSEQTHRCASAGHEVSRDHSCNIWPTRASEGNEDEDEWRRQSCLRARDRRQDCQRYFFGDPQGDEGLAGAAGHERGGAILFAERGEDVDERLGLMRERGLALRPGFLASEPCVNRREVLRFEFVEVVAGDRVERGAVLHHVGKAVAVCNERAPVNPIRLADEIGKLGPRERRAARAEFHLIGVMPAELRCKDAVHALVADGQSQPLAQRWRDTRAGPDLLRLLDGDRGEIRFGEDFKSVAAFLHGRERADAEIGRAHV